MPNAGWLATNAMPNALVRLLRSVNLCARLRYHDRGKHYCLVWKCLRRMFFHQPVYQDCCQPGPWLFRPEGRSLAASEACDPVRDQFCLLQKCLRLIRNRCRRLYPLSDDQTGPCGRHYRLDQAGRQPLECQETLSPGRIAVNEVRRRSSVPSAGNSDPELVSASLQALFPHMNQRHTNRTHSLNRMRRNTRSHSSRFRRSRS